VADPEDPKQAGGGVVDLSTRSIDTASSPELSQTGSEVAELPRRVDHHGGAGPDVLADGAQAPGPPEGADEPEHGSPGLDNVDSDDNGIPPRHDGSGASLVLEDLLLLDRDGNEPIGIDTLTFADDGIGVTRSRGDGTRILPWSSVVSHVVEAWSGGVAPEWWVDPELNRSDPQARELSSVTDPGATNRPLPHIEAGALIGIQTSTGTYRFLLPGGDAPRLSRMINALAVKQHGVAGASSVTRVVAWGQDIERRSVQRKAKRQISWHRVQPFLVVLLILFLATAVTLILLQSAGTVHLPYLGGNGAGTLGPIKTP
jgi:hypothetical protein